MKRPRKAKLKRQSGVLAFVRRSSGYKLVLVTPRGCPSSVWILPKGNVEKGMSSGDSAEKEAFEEAGIEGMRSRRPVAFYSYRKKGATHRVAVFLLRVRRMHENWDEEMQRSRELFSMPEALKVIRTPRLAKLIKKLPRLAKGL